MRLPGFTAQDSLYKTQASYRAGRQSAETGAAVPAEITPALRRRLSSECAFIGCKDIPPDGGSSFDSAYYECGTCTGPFGPEPMYCLDPGCAGCGLDDSKCLSDFPPIVTRLPGASLPSGGGVLVVGR